MSFKKRRYLLLKVLGQWKNIWRARKEDSKAAHAEETLDNAMRNLGATEYGIVFYKAFIHSWRKARKDEEAFYIVDRYLVGGFGIFDLVLFQVLVSVGHPDFASSLSWIAFVASFPCTVGSLFLSFFNKENNITAFRKVHSELSGWSELATLVSTTAFICHFWLVAGLVFLIVTIIVALLCYGYATFVFIGKHLKLPELVENADTQVTQAPVEMNLAETKPTSEDESTTNGA